MAAITTLFWDIGGVLLTNAWDHEERDLATQKFGLVKADFEVRHKELLVPLEEGKLTLEEYLERAVFYVPRPFSPKDFKEFMFSLSKPKPDVLELARQLAKNYPMWAINNESRELNQYRIQAFALREIFTGFVSSCYVGARKPDPRIYRIGLDVSQRMVSECCFIDDRPVNVESASRAGMKTILMQSTGQLQQELQRMGIKL
jgi:putative hydrolase of the HAD superfamily